MAGRQPTTHADEIPISSSGTYRAQLVTLVEDTERHSLLPRLGTVKDRSILTVLKGPQPGLVIRLEMETATFGRSSDADFYIAEPGLSRVHARISRVFTGEETEYYIEDLGSTNGTFVDGKRISQKTALFPGIRVGFGRRVLLQFSLQDQIEFDASDRVQRSAVRDPLTGVLNRGAFDQSLLAEYNYCAQSACPLSLLLVDIDFFKRCNDTYGHQGGDALLKAVALTIQRSLRQVDLLARYGGEEFAIIARGTSLRSASILAERVRQSVAATTTPLGILEISVTVSVGCSAISPSTLSTPAPAAVLSLVSAADSALYEAKRSGRNCVVAAPSR